MLSRHRFEPTGPRAIGAPAEQPDTQREHEGVSQGAIHVSEERHAEE